jgi:BCD family chlorophyll transporter-like MFS transporter
MGLWGAAQAIGFALGGLFGAVASDIARWLIGSQGAAYASVFLIEAVMFVFAAALAARIAGTAADAARPGPDVTTTRADVPGLQAGGTR